LTRLERRRRAARFVEEQVGGERDLAVQSTRWHAGARQAQSDTAQVHRGERAEDAQVAGVEAQRQRRRAARRQLLRYGPQPAELLGQLAAQRQAAPPAAGVEATGERERGAGGAVLQFELADVHHAVAVAAALDVEVTPPTR